MGKNIMDIIMISNGRTSYLRNITQYAIDTCHFSSSLIDFNIIVVEQQRNVKYKEAKTVHYIFPFNYHRCMNYGLSFTSSKYIALCNNDLDFHPLWAEKIIMAMGDKYLSASPAVRQGVGIEKGYEIARRLNGWCIVINRKVLDKIGKLDESVRFWYSDNLYADQLRAQKIEHILVKGSVVRHLGSRTLRTDRNGRDLMRKQRKFYDKARKKYENRSCNGYVATA